MSQKPSPAAPANHLVGRKLMRPQPIWDHEPFFTPEGTWGGHFRTEIWTDNGPEEKVYFDEHTPPSPMHRPFSDDGILWYWTTDPPQSPGLPPIKGIDQ